MLLLIWGLLINNKEMFLNNLSLINKYKWYCKSKYTNTDIPNNYNLKKLIIIHRHGDRVPLFIENSKWSEQNCCLCSFNKTNKTIDQCKSTQCKDGDLTIKGYKQLKKLGKHLKNTYKKIFENLEVKKIPIFVSDYPRTCASVHGVLNGLKTNSDVLNATEAPENSITQPSSCEKLSVEVKKNSKISSFDFVHKSSTEMSPEKAVDNYWTHICNDVPINCKNLNCDLEHIDKCLNISLESWQSKCQITDSDESLTKVIFGGLSKLILDSFEINSPIIIFSGHDDTISAANLGLGLETYTKPAYASYIAIEELEKSDKLFYRILYNGQFMKSFISKYDLIPEDEFKEYLRLLQADKMKVEEICREVDY